MTTAARPKEPPSPKEKKYASKVPGWPARSRRRYGWHSGVLFAITNQYFDGQNFAIDGGYTLSAGL